MHQAITNSYQAHSSQNSNLIDREANVIEEDRLSIGIGLGN